MWLRPEQQFVAEHDRMEKAYGERYKAPQLLRDKAANGETFYSRFGNTDKAKAAKIGYIP